MVDQINKRAEISSSNGASRSSLVVDSKATNGNGTAKSARRSLQLASTRTNGRGSARGPAVTIGPPVGSGGGWGRSVGAMRGGRGGFRGVVRSVNAGPPVQVGGMPKGFGSVVRSASAGAAWKRNTARMSEMSSNVLDV